MRVPAPVEELHVAHAALDQPAGQQAVVREALPARTGAIERVDLGRLAGDVHRVARRELHPVRHLVLRDARHRLGVPQLLEGPPVEGIHRVDDLPARLGPDPRRVGEVQHRVPLGAALDPLVDRRQVAGAPRRPPRAGEPAPGEQDHEPRQVLVLRAEAVGHPGAHRGVAEILAAGVQEELRRGVVELVGLHRAEEADLVEDPLEPGQAVGDPHPRLRLLVEREDRPEELRGAPDEGEPLPFEELARAVLAVELGQLGLVVEQLELAGGPLHVEEDHVLRPGRVVRRQGAERIGRVVPGFRRRRGASAPCDASQSAPRPVEQSRRKCRRVRFPRDSRRRWGIGFICSTPRRG